MQSASQKAETLAAWDRFRFGGLFQVLLTATLGVGSLATSVKGDCEKQVMQWMGTGCLILCGMWVSGMVAYTMYFSGMPIGREKPVLSMPFTRSRMVQRTSLMFLFMSVVGTMAACATILMVVLDRKQGFLSAKQAPSLLEVAAVAPPKANPFWGGDGGSLGDPGLCGDSLLAGAMSGSLGLLGVADAIGVLFVMVMGCPALCPICPGRPCGNTVPVTVSLPLFLAPIGLVYPSEEAQRLRGVMERGGGAVGLRPMPPALRVTPSARMEAAGLDPWEEVQVEAWFEPGPDGLPANAEEAALRDAFLAEVATLPIPNDPAQLEAVSSQSGAWALVTEVGSLSPSAQASYRAAMAARFGPACVAEEDPSDTAADGGEADSSVVTLPGDDLIRVADAAVMEGYQPRLSPRLRTWQAGFEPA